MSRLERPRDGAAAPAIRVYQYPGCSTCKKALAWLSTREVVFASVDIVTSPPSASDLRAMWKASGLPLAAFFNTSGVSYRAGGFKDRLPKMSDDEKLSALAADGKLIRRPVAVISARANLAQGADDVLVGFREDEYALRFGLFSN